MIHGRKLRELSVEALSVLSAYSWPGNVRELKNLIERVVILTSEAEEGEAISAAHLLRNLQDDTFTVRMEEVVRLGGQQAREAVEEAIEVLNDREPNSARNLRDARQGFEKEFILQTLKKNDWNISRTAQDLGIARSHLHRKIKSYTLTDPEA